MKGLKLALAVGMLMSLLIVSSAFANVIVVDYDDTSSNFTPPGGDRDLSLIQNGDFELWTGGQPDYWYFGNNADQPGWETTHLSRADLTRYLTGHNNGMGLFIRNIGGNGPRYAYASQDLVNIQTAGKYVVNVSYAAFYDNGTVPYNSVAWYGIGDSSDPSSVALWREIYPDRTVCQNTWQVCEYGGRHETIDIAPGQHFHVRVGHKFRVFNAWTTWIFDDFNIVPAGGEDSLPSTAGFYTWVDQNDAPAVVRWDRHAPR